MKLLVHACCGPCSIIPTRLLAAQGHDITVLYANSNIAPRAEYEKRLHELQRYAAEQGFNVVEGSYDPDAWEREVAPIGEAIKDFSPAFGEEFAAKHVGATSTGPQDARSGNADSARGGAIPGIAGMATSIESVAELLDDDRRQERCRACYRLRLEEAASYAAENGFDGLATTLAVSPYQFTGVIREELERACKGAGVAAHFEDYRPYYDEATRISRELGMYRQNYCGCRFSVKEGEATRAFIKQKRAQAKAAKAAEREAAEADQVADRKQRAAEKQAYAEERAKRRAILKQLRSQAHQSPVDSDPSALNRKE